MAVKKFEHSRKDEAIIRRSLGQDGMGRRMIDDALFPLLSPVPQGSHQFRFLPPHEGESDHWGITTFIHYQIGPNRQSHLCPRMENQTCPACALFFQARDAGDEDMQRKYRPARSVLVRYIDRAEERGMPRSWLSPFQKIDEELVIRCREEKSNGTMIRLDSPFDGRDFRFTRTGQGMTDTKYRVTAILEPSPISEDEDYMNEVLDLIRAHPLRSLYNFSTPEDIQAEIDAENKLNASQGDTEEEPPPMDEDMTPESFETSEAQSEAGADF